MANDLLTEGLGYFTSGELEQAARAWLRARLESPDNPQLVAYLAHIRSLEPALFARIEAEVTGGGPEDVPEPAPLIEQIKPSTAPIPIPLMPTPVPGGPAPTITTTAPAAIALPSSSPQPVASTPVTEPPATVPMAVAAPPGDTPAAIALPSSQPANPSESVAPESQPPATVPMVSAAADAGEGSSPIALPSAAGTAELAPPARVPAPSMQEPTPQSGTIGLPSSDPESLAPPPSTEPPVTVPIPSAEMLAAASAGLAAAEPEPPPSSASAVTAPPATVPMVSPPGSEPSANVVGLPGEEDLADANKPASDRLTQPLSQTQPDEGSSAGQPTYREEITAPIPQVPPISPPVPLGEEPTDPILDPEVPHQARALSGPLPSSTAAAKRSGPIREASSVSDPRSLAGLPRLDLDEVAAAQAAPAPQAAADDPTVISAAPKFDDDATDRNPLPMAFDDPTDVSVPPVFDAMPAADGATVISAAPVLEPEAAFGAEDTEINASVLPAAFDAQPREAEETVISAPQSMASDEPTTVSGPPPAALGSSPALPPAPVASEPENTVISGPPPAAFASAPPPASSAADAPQLMADIPDDPLPAGSGGSSSAVVEVPPLMLEEVTPSLFDEEVTPLLEPSPLEQPSPENPFAKETPFDQAGDGAAASDADVWGNEPTEPLTASDPWGDPTEREAITVEPEASALDILESSDSAADAPQPDAADVDVTSLELRLREHFELNDFSGALDLADEILAVESDHVVARELRGASEAKLRAMYASKIGDRDAVPRVLKSPEELIWLDLDHRSGFVLAQIDGMSSYDEIVEVTGMEPLESYRIMAKLVQDGVIGPG